MRGGWDGLRDEKLERLQKYQRRRIHLIFELSEEFGLKFKLKTETLDSRGWKANGYLTSCDLYWVELPVFTAATGATMAGAACTSACR